MRTHVVVVLICLFPLVAEAQLAEPFQKRSPPNISLNEDTKYQLARKHAGDQALADLGYRPTMGPNPGHARRKQPASFTAPVGVGDHALVVYPSADCSNVKLTVRPLDSETVYLTQYLQGAPIVYLEAPQKTGLRIRVDNSSDKSCGFQFVIYDRR